MALIHNPESDLTTIARQAPRENQQRLFDSAYGMKSAMTGFGDSAHGALASLLPGGSSGSAFKTAEVQRAPLTAAELHLPAATIHKDHIAFSSFVAEHAEKKTTDKSVHQVKSAEKALTA